MPKIVIADDDPNMTELVKEILEEDGHSVVVAHDGRAAVEAYRREKPEMVILDVSMPIMDGLAACQQIRADDTGVLILFLTGQKTQVNTVMGLEAGADGYLTKPFGARELTARVKSLLRRLEA
jgi:DNA-binding response OmpR family regulator